MSNQPVRARTPRKYRSLSEALVNEFSTLIREGEIKQGEKLPTELQIMKDQNVSRTVVREALSRLQAAGLVETRHGVGTFVLDIPNHVGFCIDPATIVTLRDVLAVLELRISLEVESAGLACLRRTDQDLRLMREALDVISAVQSSVSEAVAADFQFHLQIAFATGNRYFTDIMQHLGASIIPRARMNTARLANAGLRQYLDRVNSEHQVIYQAIARQDCDAARSAMRLHLINSRERLRTTYAAIEANGLYE